MSNILRIELEGRVFLADYDQDGVLLERTELDSTLIAKLVRNAIETSLVVMVNTMEGTHDQGREEKEEKGTPAPVGMDQDDEPHKTGSTSGREKETK